MLSGALWMPMGSLNRAWGPTSLQPYDKPYTYAKPTISLVRDAKPYRDSNRMNIEDPFSFITKGLHMTYPAFIPSQILKDLTCTEGGGKPGPGSMEEMVFESVEDLNIEQDHLYNLDYREKWKSETIPLDQLSEEDREDLGYVPWFLECQPQRFPYWFGKHDGRNNGLFKLLVALQESDTFDYHN